MLGSTYPRRALVGAGILMVLSVMAPTAQAAAPSSQPRPVLEAASVKPNGRTSGFMYGQPAVSDDGQRVAFISNAGTLVPGVTGDCGQVYVRDRAKGVTLLASSGEDGAPASGGCNTGASLGMQTPMSADGGLVAFLSDATSLLPGAGKPKAHVFVKHVVTGRLERIAMPREPSRPAGESRTVAALAMSSDGRYLGLTVRLGENGPNDVGYLYDRQSHAWRLVCQPMVWRCEVAAVSPNGRYVAYAFEPKTLAPGHRPMPYVFDRLTGQSRRVVAAPGWNGHNPGLMQFADDGSTLIISWLSAGDTETSAAVTVHRTSDFAQKEQIRFPGLGGAFGVDRTGQRLVISYSRAGHIGFDQPYDAYVYDRDTRRLSIASVAADGQPGNAWSIPGDITPDGRTVVMGTSASNLAPGDRPGDDEYGRDCVVATFPPRIGPRG